MFTKMFNKLSVTLVVATAVPVILQGSALAYESPLHVFSVDDVMGGFCRHVRQ